MPTITPEAIIRARELFATIPKQELELWHQSLIYDQIAIQDDESLPSAEREFAGQWSMPCSPSAMK